MRRLIVTLTFLLTLALLAHTAFAQTPAPDVTPEATPESTAEATPEATAAALIPIDVMQPDVLNTYPHDTTAYTEGLLLHDGFLYESTGEYGQSDIRKVELETGKVLQKEPNAPENFGEGLALVDDHLIQLTWKEQQAFIYDLDTFKKTGELTYQGEGWGLCYDGEQIWMSNGSDTLVTRDPQTFEVTRRIQLKFQGYTLAQVNTSSGVPLSSIFSQVNELECVGDSIYANVWLTNFILRIDAASGEITGIIDASDLLTTEERSQLSNGAVLNGIAYNPDSETFYITGKDWPKLFEVKFNVVDTISMGG